MTLRHPAPPSCAIVLEGVIQALSHDRARLAESPGGGGGLATLHEERTSADATTGGLPLPDRAAEDKTVRAELRRQLDRVVSVPRHRVEVEVPRHEA